MTDNNNIDPEQARLAIELADSKRIRDAEQEVIKAALEVCDGGLSPCYITTDMIRTLHDVCDAYRALVKDKAP